MNWPWHEPEFRQAFDQRVQAQRAWTEQELKFAQDLERRRQEARTGLDMGPSW